MHVRLRDEADEGERFAPTAYDGQLGEMIPLTDRSGNEVPARLISVTVAPDGKSAVLELEVPDGTDLVGVRGIEVGDV